MAARKDRPESTKCLNCGNPVVHNPGYQDKDLCSKCAKLLTDDLYELAVWYEMTNIKEEIVYI